MGWRFAGTAAMATMGRRMSMYCNGNCEHLDRKRKKCLLTGNKLCYMKVRGSISYDVYEHIGFCKKDEENTEK